jgi:hypothetical protein
VEQKIFSENKTPCNRHQKISTTAFWRSDPPGIGISKISEDASKKKRYSAAFSAIAFAC